MRATASIFSFLTMMGVVTSAHATSVDLSSYVNADLSTYTQGYNYPINSTTIGGVAFNLAPAASTAGPGALQTLDNSFAIKSLNISDASFAYTIINSSFGQSGANVGTIAFIGSGGAAVSYTLTEGVNVRDHYYGMYNNVATDLYATAAYNNGTQVSDAPGLVHFDVQKFSLAGLNGENLVEIDFIGNNSGGGEPFLAAVTTTSGVPEASTWAMMLLGFAGLGFVGYRAKPRGR